MTIKGMDRFLKKLDRISVKSQKMVKKAVFVGATEVHSDAITLINTGTRSGRIYRRGGVSHQASAPGEAPKTDTGALVGRIFINRKRNGFSYEVGTNIPYGKHLEYGTSRMRPRPWLYPTFNKNIGQIKKNIGIALLKAFKQG